MVVLWVSLCKESFWVPCCPCQQIHRYFSTARIFNGFFLHLSRPSFSWHSAQAIQYHCCGDIDGKLFDGDIFSSLFPILYFSFSLSLSTGSSCLSCSTFYLVPTAMLTHALKVLSKRFNECIVSVIMLNICNVIYFKEFYLSKWTG